MVERKATDSHAEREKYQRIWTHEVYAESRTSVEHAEVFLREVEIPPGASIIDFGCGAGHASRHLHERGHRVLGIDIAGNAIDLLGLDSFAFLRACLWELPVQLRADYGFCVDMMEHLPPERVRDVLKVIATTVERTAFFCISVRPDGCGRLINDILHLTVRPPGWWMEELAALWPDVRIVEEREGDWFSVVARR